MKNKIILRGKEVVVTYKKNKVVNYQGDETLIQYIKPYFEQSVETIYSKVEGEKDATVYVELKPGDSGYISAVLLDKLQNELGMEVE